MIGQIIIKFQMFLFSCCRSNDSGKGYEIITDDKNTFVNNYQDISQKDLNNPSTRILSVQKSAYNELMKKYKGTTKQWTDPEFLPNPQNIGIIQGIRNPRWKRISQILTNNPQLFEGGISPTDVIQGSLGDCYFLSAISAVAERPNRIKEIFGQQSYNINGIYKVQLRIQGAIEQIIVDDWIPVNQNQRPIFCQPNKNEFWVLILEKAWAKAHGGYSNIISGIPTEVFRAITYAPAELLLVKQSQSERQKLWNRLIYHARRDDPCCCGTGTLQTIDWAGKGLAPGHAYTLIDAENLIDSQEKTHRMLKLRNPWGNTQWQGEGSEKDVGFWSKINQSLKNKFLGQNNHGNDGIFYMRYEDFCNYFTQTHFCMFERNASYISQNLYCNKKNGSIYKVKINRQGQYTFELHQPCARKNGLFQEVDGLCRGTLILAKWNKGAPNQYQFIDGCLRYAEEDVTLRARLNPGNYLIYAKLDPTRKLYLIPQKQKTSVSIYSVNLATLEPDLQSKYPDFLKNMFLDHARKNIREYYDNNLIWVTWKLLYKQGGYGYIAFGNDKTSKKKIVVNFSQEDFQKLNFHLKKPYKGKGNNQLLEVYPGQEKIILARVNNIEVKSLSFPPHPKIQLQSIQNQ